MTYTWRCPECGQLRITNNSDWAEWCVNHEMITVWTERGVERKRKIVKMEREGL